MVQTTGEKPTPMMLQWMEAKSAHPEAILFFRMGDFYELFGDDAVEASRVLELTLTSRDRNKEDGMPMAGVPHHQLQPYVQRLLDSGFKVAVCDQVEDPKKAKGIVKRAVTRIVTPGVVMNDIALEPTRNNYLCALWPGLNGYGLAYTDITTGEFKATLATDINALVAELGRIEAREVLVPPETEDRILATVVASGGVCSEWPVDAFSGRHAVAQPYAALGDEPQRAVGAIGAYVDKTRPTGDVMLGSVESYALDTHLIIEETSYRNLEVVKTMIGGRRQGTLLGLLDRTCTAMGARQLRRWLQRPLRERIPIEERQDAIGELKDDTLGREMLRALLSKVYDIERLGGRVMAGLASPKDLANLRQSLENLSGLRTELGSFQAKRLTHLAETMDPLADIHKQLSDTLADEPAPSATDGRLIRDGFDAELDEFVHLTRSGKDWMLQYEQSERDRTGISSLKVRYNRVFGYFIEVTKANLQHVPDDYIRKQTLANGERYYTVELKEYETKVLSAEERRMARETQLFEELRATLQSQAARILRTAGRVADLDVLCALAEAAYRYGYVRPTLSDEHKRIHLVACRHPVVEQSINGVEFVPNDIVLDADAERVILITGPNMSGKSTIMRQVALIVLMAQMGSFIPADEGEIGLVDRIFTRVGATDDLSRGQSTFMVEMSETADILRNATSQSLIILDEIGRGTSTYDGVSIAWAVTEFIHESVGARTLFATHYHELTELERTLPHVKNMHVAVREWNDEIVFLRKLQAGGTNRSYGIQVGRLAGLPETVLSRARERLSAFEARDTGSSSEEQSVSSHVSPGQLGLFGAPAPASAPEASALEMALKRLNLNRTTPLEALNLLSKWQRKLDS